MRYDGATLKRFSTEDGLPSNRVRTVFERQDGTFLAACTGGVAVIDGDRVTRVYGESDGISNIEVLTVSARDNGDIFLGTDGGGIYVLRGEALEHYDTGSGLYSDVVMRLKKDNSPALFWNVTSNSLAYMSGDGEITTIRKFPYSNNFDLYENSRGEMWVLSSNGIYVAPVEELLANGEIDPTYYGRDDGLPCIAAANSYSELTADGDLYISGTTGVTKVNIETSSQEAAVINMTVPYMEADGVRVYPDENGVISIASDVNRLTIYGHVFTYSLGNPEVTYYLEGLDQEPTTVLRSDLTPVSYTNLKGGPYRFVMTIPDSAGVVGNELSIQVEKQKSVREMLWYRVLRFAAVVLIVALIIMYRFHRKTMALVKKHEETKTFIREMTEAFAKTIDMKDKYTNGHSFRVAKYTKMLARELGYDVLKDISIMPELAIGAGMHHERPDGRGYPQGLTGDEIPRVAQIIAVADTFDAMYSTRPYRKRMNFYKVVSIIKKASGTQLTPDVVDAFLRLAEKGELRNPSDTGGGSTEEVDNLLKAGASGSAG